MPAPYFRGGPYEDLFRAAIEVNDVVRFVDRNDGIGGDRQNVREHRVRSAPFLIETLTLRELGPYESLSQQCERDCRRCKRQRRKSGARGSTSTAKEVVHRERERNEQDS